MSVQHESPDASLDISLPLKRCRSPNRVAQFPEMSPKRRRMNDGSSVSSPSLGPSLPTQTTLSSEELRVRSLPRKERERLLSIVQFRNRSLPPSNSSFAAPSSSHRSSPVRDQPQPQPQHQPHCSFLGRRSISLFGPGRNSNIGRSRPRYDEVITSGLLSGRRAVSPEETVSRLVSSCEEDMAAAPRTDTIGTGGGGHSIVRVAPVSVNSDGRPTSNSATLMAFPTILPGVAAGRRTAAVDSHALLVPEPSVTGLPVPHPSSEKVPVLSHVVAPAVDISRVILAPSVSASASETQSPPAAAQHPVPSGPETSRVAESQPQRPPSSASLRLVVSPLPPPPPVDFSVPSLLVSLSPFPSVWSDSATGGWIPHLHEASLNRMWQRRQSRASRKEKQEATNPTPKPPEPGSGSVAVAAAATAAKSLLVPTTTTTKTSGNDDEEVEEKRLLSTRRRPSPRGKSPSSRASPTDDDGGAYIPPSVDDIDSDEYDWIHPSKQKQVQVQESRNRKPRRRTRRSRSRKPPRQRRRRRRRTSKKSPSSSSSSSSRRTRSRKRRAVVVAAEDDETGEEDDGFKVVEWSSAGESGDETKNPIPTTVPDLVDKVHFVEVKKEGEPRIRAFLTGVHQNTIMIRKRKRASSAWNRKFFSTFPDYLTVSNDDRSCAMLLVIPLALIPASVSVLNMKGTFRWGLFTSITGDDPDDPDIGFRPVPGISVHLRDFIDPYSMKKKHNLLNSYEGCRAFPLLVGRKNKPCNMHTKFRRIPALCSRGGQLRRGLVFMFRFEDAASGFGFQFLYTFFAQEPDRKAVRCSVPECRVIVTKRIRAETPEPVVVVDEEEEEEEEPDSIPRLRRRRKRRQ